MPRAPLIPAAPPPPIPGLVGKLPATGDFVTRALPRVLAAWLDRWATHHLASRLTRPVAFRLTVAPGPLSGIAAPSRDSAGRAFPLLLAAPAAPAPAAPWFAALVALAATAAETDADALAERLAALPAPPDDPDPTPLLLWTPGRPPHPADPEDPGPVVAVLCAGAG